MYHMPDSGHGRIFGREILAPQLVSEPSSTAAYHGYYGIAVDIGEVGVESLYDAVQVEHYKTLSACFILAMSTV
jgi:hypothetical protein